MARVARDWRGGKTTVGSLLTAVHRRADDEPAFARLHSAACVGGLDARHRFGGGNYELLASVFASQVEGQPSAITRTQRLATRLFQRPDAEHLHLDSTSTALGGASANLQLSRTGGGHWRWQLTGLVLTPGFEVNDLGYGQAVDRARQYANLGYVEWRPQGRFRSWSLQGSGWSEWNFGGERQKRGASLWGMAELTDGTSGYLGASLDGAGLDPSALRGGPALATPTTLGGFFGLNTDSRRPVRLDLYGAGEVERGTGGHSWMLEPSVRVRPSTRGDLTIGAAMVGNANPTQYLGTARSGPTPRFRIGRLDQTTVALVARANLAFTPELSFQFYAQPFVSDGEFSDSREIRSPRARRFGDQFAPAGAIGSELDFHVAEFRSNAVLRWEYRPGSTIFVVWSQNRSGSGPQARLRDAPPTDVLLLKVSYWLGM